MLLEPIQNDSAYKEEDIDCYIFDVMYEWGVMHRLRQSGKSKLDE